jgi:hypothetical protein
MGNRGKWEKFSLEVLITLATRAGLHVSLNRRIGMKRGAVLIPLVPLFHQALQARPTALDK